MLIALGKKPTKAPEKKEVAAAKGGGLGLRAGVERLSLGLEQTATS